jgi:hypothetical protein
MSNERKERFREFVKQLEKIEDGAKEEEQALWGGVQGSFTQQTDLSNSPNYKEIVTILHQNPLLVAPTLKFLQVRRAAMARAQLEVLYTPEELEQMMEEAKAR